jgi:hypothetical protein
MRLGIALRLAGFLILASFVIIEGSAIKNRTFEGKSEHYTVVLAANADPNSETHQASKQGAHVEEVVSNSTTKAYEASMTSHQATKIENDPMVDYVEMDSAKTVHHSWWDTTLIAMHLRTPDMAGNLRG